MSSHFYVVCEFGEEMGRVLFGNLHQDKLLLTETRRFPNLPIKEKGSLQWNVPQLHQGVLDGLREIGSHDEPVHGVTCSSWNADYMLFGSDGSVITPNFHSLEGRAEAGLKEILEKVTLESIYAETGVGKIPASTLFQMGGDKAKRFKKAQLMSVGDGFNFLLSGVPRVETSAASLTQLYNPVAKTWSDKLLAALEFPPTLFPQVVPAGTKLGLIREDIGKEIKLEDAKVIAACSHEMAASLVGLPIESDEHWAFLKSGASAVLGTELDKPVINDASREWNFSNQAGYGGTFSFFKHTIGLSMLEECRKSWKEKDKELDADVLLHLAISAPPFESLINLSDPRFREPGDMPAKIQAYCRETDQTVPRKPGPTARCVLESLALHYRQTLCEMEYLTGRKFTRLYIFGAPTNSLLNHFTANAMQLPVVLVPYDTAAVGNMMVQALALGHVKLFDQARDIVKNSFKSETIIPHATAWDAASNRLAELAAAAAA